MPQAYQQLKMGEAARAYTNTAEPVAGHGDV